MLLIMNSNNFVVVPSRGTSMVFDSEMPAYDELRSKILANPNDEEYVLNVIQSWAKPLEGYADGLSSTSAGLEVSVDEDKLVLPVDMMEVVRAFKSAKIPYKHLYKFWQRCVSNPNRGSTEQLFRFLNVNTMAITLDGCFIAYKYVDMDYMDVHSGKYNNSPGAVIEMPRDEVEFDPQVACAPGLHVASKSYAVSNRPCNGKVVIVKVDPVDVVSVPVDHANQKMRVCKYKVLADFNPDMEVAKLVDDDLRAAYVQPRVDSYLDRAWSESELDILSSQLDSLHTDKEVDACASRFAQFLVRNFEDVKQMLNALMTGRRNAEERESGSSQATEEPAAEEAVSEVSEILAGSYKLSKDIIAKVAELVKQHGHKWTLLYTMLGGYNSLGCTVDTLRKLAKRMGL